MEQLEDDFVAGLWIPSFLKKQEPKKQKKRKHDEKLNKAKESQLQKKKVKMSKG